VAGDIARGDGAELTTAEHVLNAKHIARSVEQQLANNSLERRKDYQMFKSSGASVGRVNGLAVMGEDSGIVLPIMAEVTPTTSKSEGHLIATGKLRSIAREAVQNVSAFVKKVTGQDVANMDIHVQFIGTYEGVEGDSASISIATAVLSAIENIPVDQSVAMTGSLSVRGDVLPVGGVTYKIEAAAQAGMKKVIIPRMNMGDVLIEKEYSDRIKIVPVSTIVEVLENTFVGERKRKLVDVLKEVAAKTMNVEIPQVPSPQKV